MAAEASQVELLRLIDRYLNLSIRYLDFAFHEVLQ
jgi:hypothetical protein